MDRCLLASTARLGSGSRSSLIPHPWTPVMPFKANAAGRHHIPRQRQRVTNWPEYDAALRRRGSLTVWVTDEAIAAWQAEPRTTRGGQPRYSQLAIATALTLRTVFRLGLRQTEGLIGSVIGLLGLDLSVPDHSTLSRRAEKLEVVRSACSTAPVHLLVDSTGLKLCGAGEWLVEKHSTARRRSWRKLHIGVDADTGQILASALTTNDVDDASQVSALLAIRSTVPSCRSSGTVRMTRKQSTPMSPNATLRPASLFRRERRLCRVPCHKAHQRRGIVICRRLRGAVGCSVRRHRATIRVPRSRRRSVAT